MKNKLKCKQLLIVLFVFTFSAAIASGQNCGDINADGLTDIVDALLVAQCYVGLTSCPPADIGDVNCDGVIDILDALLIAQFYVDLVPTLECCETPTPTPGEDVTHEMQAEDATWSSGGVESDHSGYTGSGYVNMDNAEGEWIEWTIDVDRDCNATCEFTYAASGSARPMDLSVKGNVQTSVSFPDTGGWTIWNTDTGDIILSGGSNAIRLTATNSNGAPNIDKMDITISGGIVVTPTPTAVPTPTPTADPNKTPMPDDVLIGWASEAGGTTGGGDRTPVVVDSLSELNDAAGGSESRVIHVDGQFSGTLSVGSNKTIIGLSGARITNGGAVLRIGSSSNVIIKNIHFQGSCDGSSDMANINGGHHIWIDHCNLVNGGDGMLDIVHGANYITISWCKMWYTEQTGHQNAFLISHSDSAGDDGKMKVTFHHNWWSENIAERQPRVRFGQVHIFNNLYIATQGFTSYAIRPGYKANIRSESNIFYDFTGQSIAADDAKHEYGECLVFNYAFNRGDSILETIDDVFINCTERGIDADDVEGGTFGNGTAFTPPYEYSTDDTATLEDVIRAGAGPR